MRTHLCLSLSFFSLTAFAFPGLPVSTQSADTSKPESVSWVPCDEPYRQMTESRAFYCAEQAFWAGFGAMEKRDRERADQALSEAISRTRNTQERASLGRLHFLRASVRMALGLEHGDMRYTLLAPFTVQSEIKTAMRLDPENTIYGNFLDTIDIAYPALMNNWSGAARIAERAFARIPENPTANALTVSGTTMAFPMSSGFPQRSRDLMAEWECVGVPYCEQNTAKGPFVRPGLNYHFAEVYGRVGEMEKATFYLNAALAAPGASSWRYRWVAEEARADVDGFINRFTELRDDEGAYSIVYTNKNYACSFCHGR